MNQGGKKQYVNVTRACNIIPHNEDLNPTMWIYFEIARTDVDDTVADSHVSAYKRVLPVRWYRIQMSGSATAALSFYKLAQLTNVEESCVHV